MDLIAEFALSRVGDGYIYGAKGQKCSPAFRKIQAEQYPEWSNNILNVGAKWDGKPVWDCAQLTRFAAAAAGYNISSGANSQWTKVDWKRKGDIKTLPEGETVFLYREGSGRMQHTGIAIGDGTCVHAKSTKDGVIRQPMTGYNWTHWASLTAQKIKSEDTQMKVTMVTSGDGNPVKLRPAPSTQDDYIAKLDVGTTVEILGNHVVDGVAWSYIRASTGKSGYMMSKFLEDGEIPDPPSKTVTVTFERELAQQVFELIAAALGR